MKIDVKSSCLVPMAATYSSLSPMVRVELTPWELSFLQLDPIQKGILLHKPSPHSWTETLPIIGHLKDSLSRALAFFPMLTGRLHIDVNDEKCTMHVFVDCNNAGAKFTHAAVRTLMVSDVIQPTYTPEIVSSFFPLNGVLNYEGVSKPLVAVQVTELVDGYFIGCTINHCIADGTSFWHFFNSWSEVSRGLNTISKPPNFKRWFPSNVSKDNFSVPIPAWDHNLSNEVVRTPLLERVFHFSKENVARLKALANAEAQVNGKISSLQALLAHLWRSVLRVRQKHRINGTTTGEEAVFFLLVGARPRIPLPEGYFGNAVYVDKTTLTVDEVLNKGLGYAALKINQLVAKQTSHAAVRYIEDWIRNPVFWKKGRYDFVISSSPRFDIYGCDFGWGKPITVRSGKGQKCDGKMTLYSALKPGGIDVEACLAPETLWALEEEDEFLKVVHA